MPSPWPGIAHGIPSGGWEADLLWLVKGKERVFGHRLLAKMAGTAFTWPQHPTLQLGDLLRSSTSGSLQSEAESIGAAAFNLRGGNREVKGSAGTGWKCFLLPLQMRGEPFFMHELQLAAIAAGCWQGEWLWQAARSGN